MRLALAASAVLGAGANVDIDELILHLHAQSLPLEESIGPIANALADRTVIVPTAEPVPAPPVPVQLRVGPDVQGRLWVYAYTSQARFAEVFPADSTHATIKFSALFQIVDGNPDLAGILLNSGWAAPYPIMRVLFDHVRSATRRSTNG